MATTSSIGTTGRNFTTIQAWHDAFATGGWIGQCYNDSEFTVTSTVSMTGKTTSGTDFMTLQCGAGQSFKDNANVQTNALRYNVSNGVGVRKTNAYGSVINPTEDFTTISNIQFQHSGGGNSAQAFENNVTGTTNSIFEGLILEITAGNSNVPVMRMRSGLCRNSLIVNRGTAGNGIDFAYPVGTPTFVNCTIVRPSDKTTSGTGITSNSGGWKVENCAVFNFTTLNSGGTASGSNNCSDLAIGFGTSNQASKTYANQFVATADATRDFRLKAGANCLDNAVTDTTNIPAAIDIVGTSRPQGTAWDISCWELVQSVVTVVVNNLTLLAAG